MKKSELIYVFVAVFSLTYMLLFLDLNQINLLLPLLAIVSIGFYVLFSLIRREGKLELFDGGAILIAITALYSTYPLLSLAMNGFEITPFADNRFKENQITASQVGLFAWNHVIYIAALSYSYLYFRPNKVSLNIQDQSIKTVSKGEILIGLLFMIFLTLYSVIIPILFGDSPPYFIKQLNNNFASLFFIMSIWFFVIALTNWNNNFFKILLFIYLLFELFKVVTGISGRSWFALHLIAFGILYHKLISPFSTRQVFVYGFLFIVFFLIFGFMATGQTGLISLGVGFFTGNEEFTAVFATAYDIQMLINSGKVQEIPPQVIYFDLLNLIPSQLLPFEKIAQTDWYLILKGLQDDGIGLAFGVMAQGVIGFGKFELILRGILTGAFYGYLHKLINKRNLTVWMLVLYVFLLISGYQTYRAGTGYLLYFIVYQYLPCYLLIKFFLISAKPNASKLKTY